MTRLCFNYLKSPNFPSQKINLSSSTLFMVCLATNCFAATISVDGFTLAECKHTWTIPFNDNLDLLPTTPLQLSQSIPVALSPTGRQGQTFNVIVKKFALKLWEEAGGPPPQSPLQDNAQDFALSYRPNSTSIKSILSIKFTVDGDARDSSRSNEIFANFNYEINRLRLLEASDLFDTSQNWCPELTAQAVAVLQNNSGGAIPESFGQNLYEISQGMQQWTCDPQRWIVISKGLEINYRLGEIASYASGTQSTLLPWTLLKQILNHAALKALPDHPDQ